jgi:hypothetical protein
LAISWGSQIAVVMPRGVTQRSNSKGVTSERFDVQMRVDEARHQRQARDVDRPRAPRRSSPTPTIVSPQIATSPSIISPVTRSKTCAAAQDEIGGAHRRAPARSGFPDPP